MKNFITTLVMVSFTINFFLPFIYFDAFDAIIGEIGSMMYCMISIIGIIVAANLSYVRNKRI